MRFTRNAIVILECALSVLFGNAAPAQAPVTELPLQIGARVRVSSSTPGPFSSARVGAVLAEPAPVAAGCTSESDQSSRPIG